MNGNGRAFFSSGISHDEIVKLSSEYRAGLSQSVQKENKVKYNCPANFSFVLFSTKCKHFLAAPINLLFLLFFLSWHY